MAIVTSRVDDFDKSPDAQPVRLALEYSTDGTEHRQSIEIDLSDTNLEKLLNAVDKYLSTGRRVSDRSASRPRSSRKRRTAAPETALIRDWANANGHAVGDRGRIPDHVKTAYDKAHETSPSTAPAKGVSPQFSSV